MGRGLRAQGIGVEKKRKTVHRAIAPPKPENGDGIAAPWPLPRFEAPTFPSRIFNIADYGAIPGFQTDCADAIAKAMKACAAAGGGRVLIPPGNWFTGAIHL